MTPSSQRSTRLIWKSRRTVQSSAKLAGYGWIDTGRTLVVTGPCGICKSWLACALGQEACRQDLSIPYHRVPRLLSALGLARGGSRCAKLVNQLVRAQLLVSTTDDPSRSRPSRPGTW